MAEQLEGETQQKLQGAGPLLLSAAAAAAAGALTVVVRKALSGGGGGGPSGESTGSSRGTSFDDVDEVADDLERLVEELRSESRNRSDSPRLVEIADLIGEYADQAANAFHAAASGADPEGEASERRVTDELMSRISELTRSDGEKAGSGSPRKSAAKSPS
jgi:hypothetical protein